jgi:hypothetical protein
MILGDKPLIFEVVLSQPWDKGTLGTKPKEYCPGPPRQDKAGSNARSASQLTTSFVKRGQRWAVHHVLGASLDCTWGPGSTRGRCLHTGSPLKTLAQMTSEPTPEECVTWSNACGLTAARCPCRTAATLVGASRQNNTK